MNWDEPHPRRLPTPEEIIRIKDEVALLNSEIASLYTYLHELERDRDNKASFIAPIRRLPPEILGEIAMACLHVGVPPYTLGQVSSSMRNTVNSMKKLWSSIHYFVPRGHNVPDIGQAVTPGYVPVYTLDYLDLVLERSNLMPLRITLQSWNYDVLNTIGPFFNMVKKMKIIDDGRYFYERETSFWPSGVYDLTGIQDIEFYGRGTFASATNRFLTEFSRELSNDVRISLDFPDKALMTLLCTSLIRSIKSLNLTFADKPGNETRHTSFLNVVLRNLKDLAICGSCQCMLRELHLSNLLSLHLQRFGCSKQTPTLPDNIKALTLEDICISWACSEPQQLSNLVSISLKGVFIMPPTNYRIEVPNLKILHLATSRFTPNGRDSILDLNTIVGPEGLLSSIEALRELSILAMTLGSNTPSVLQVHPTITKLSLTRVTFRFELLSSLAEVDMVNQKYLPELTELRLERCRATQRTLSFQQLREECAKVRPELRIVGDNIYSVIDTVKYIK